ncbi:CHASE3 domain-containing protein [Pseudoalteromonas sp. SR41-8]|uniref:sensor histidine kinase n=1 Tax=unclassified Pseudoalteromonas TaxID=194690 RepID=UPI00160379BC|nr:MULTISPECIES: sensor histidine kinase [unclassified Pseudoalteromonas]MBB1310610.1 CHASE3 domain-containing protein [Pseudoalteromonas sp. SR41-8]MBB1397093.1 CHASE3 domain-containing protein [Pseudoalteromonas sp. SG44-8]
MKLQKQQGKVKVTWASFIAVLLCIVVGNAILAMNTIQSLTQTQQRLDDTNMLNTAIEKLHLSIVQAESGQRGYLLTGDKDYLAPYNDAIMQLNSQATLVKNLRTEIAGQADKVARLLFLVDDKVAVLTRTVDLALADKERRAHYLLETHQGRKLYEQIRVLADEIQDAESAFKTVQFRKLGQIKKEAKLTFAITAVTSALLILGMFMLTRINLHTAAKYQQELEYQNETLASKVTERTQELTLYSDELSRSNRELEEFAFVASHDLQEPLRKIQAFSDRLETMFKDELGEKGVDYIARMKNAAQRMSNLINDLLEFSRVTTRGKDFADTDLKQVLDDVLSDLEIAIKESNAQVNVGEMPVIQADLSQMQQLFLNLISNAVKFRRPDVAPIITIEYQHHTEFNDDYNTELEWQIITVKDNGIGFAPEYTDKIFVPFQRLHGRSQYKGTGIGLSVCRRIVERHGGTIAAQSETGEGATFIIKLPVESELFTLQGEA